MIIKQNIEEIAKEEFIKDNTSKSKGVLTNREKKKHGCPDCPAFGKYCPRPPRKEDYKFPEEENQYLIDKECGVYSCQETVDRLMEKIRWRKFPEETPEPDIYYVSINGKQFVDIWTGTSWVGQQSVDYWMPRMTPPLIGMASDLGD